MAVLAQHIRLRRACPNDPDLRSPKDGLGPRDKPEDDEGGYLFSSSTSWDEDRQWICREAYQSATSFRGGEAEPGIQSGLQLNLAVEAGLPTQSGKNTTIRTSGFRARLTPSRNDEVIWYLKSADSSCP